MEKAIVLYSPEQPPDWSYNGRDSARQAVTLEAGSRLGHYDVTAKIGEGGVGEVYRARDTKLDRDVALSSSLYAACCTASYD